MDFLGPSDAPLNRGGWAARQARQAAADEGAAGAGAPAVAPPAAPAPSPAGDGTLQRVCTGEEDLP